MTDVTLLFLFSSNYILVYIFKMLFSCLRARVFIKQVSQVSCVTLVDGLEGRIGFRIRLGIHQEAVLVCLYLLRRAADYDESPAAVGAYTLEA